MILAILFAVLGYRRADETGRNKILWAILMVVIFLASQAVAGLIIGVLVGIGIAAFGWSDNIFNDYYWQIAIVGVAISVGVCSLVLYLLGQSQVTDDVDEAPPAPSEFGLDD